MHHSLTVTTAQLFSTEIITKFVAPFNRVLVIELGKDHIVILTI
jgi:hypothetical protein